MVKFKALDLARTRTKLVGTNTLAVTIHPWTTEVSAVYIPGMRFDNGDLSDLLPILEWNIIGVASFEENNYGAIKVSFADQSVYASSEQAMRALVDLVVMYGKDIPTHVWDENDDD